MKTVSLVVAAATLSCQMAFAQQVQEVHFPAGASGTSLSGAIKGYDYTVFTLGAAEGQVMTINMQTDNASAYFNVFEPGKGPGDEAMFIGNIAGNSFSGPLPATGDYSVQVYMMRSAARRDEVANYTLDIAITAGGAMPNEEASPQASGSIPCKYGPGVPTSSCDFTVTRMAGGEATVHIMTPDGGERYIYFENGMVSSTDAAGGFETEIEGDLTIIELDTGERYEIPEAVVFGG